MIKNATWLIGRREIIAMAVGICLYAGITAVTSFANLGEAIGGDLRPAIAIPIFFGFVFGPIVGFVVGALGNLLYDAYAGWLHFPPDPRTGSWLLDLATGLLLNWEIGNGLIGFIPGLRALYHRRYRSWREQLWALIFLTAGISAGVGFAAFTDIFLYPDIGIATFMTQFPPIVRVNLINALLLVPLLLYNYERLDWRDRRWLRSSLLLRFLVTILLSAALPTALLSMFLSNQSAGLSTNTTLLTTRLALTVALTAGFTLVNAVLLAQSILRPLLDLTEAAHAVMQGRFGSQQAAELRAVDNDQTELSYLRQAFGQMAEEVITREQNLRKQVDELQIIIDDSRRKEHVSEITESDFFRELQGRAAALRSRRGHQRADSELNVVASALG